MTTNFEKFKQLINTIDIAQNKIRIPDAFEGDTFTEGELNEYQV